MKIETFEMKNIPLFLEVVVPLWSPQSSNEAFRRFNVEYIIRNNIFENDFHFQLTDEDSSEVCSAAFFARKGDICNAEKWFKENSKVFSKTELISSAMSRTYLELMDKKTFALMNKDDIKLSLFISRKKGCGSLLLNELCGRFKKQGFKNLYLWTDCECDWQWYTKHGYKLVLEDVYAPFSDIENGELYKTYIFTKPL